MENEKSEHEQQATETIIAKKGKTIRIEYEDGTEGEVLVKLLKIRDMPDYFAAIEDEIKLIQLVTGLTEEEVEQIDFTSQLDIADAAQEINFQRALRWVERRADVTEKLLPTAQRGASVKRQLTKS